MHSLPLRLNGAGLVCTPERQCWESWVGKEPGSRNVPTCPHGLWICSPRACTQRPRAQREHKNIPDTVLWAGRTAGMGTTTAGISGICPRRQSSCWCCGVQGLIFGICTLREEENPPNSGGASAKLLRIDPRGAGTEAAQSYGNKMGVY